MQQPTLIIFCFIRLIILILMRTTLTPACSHIPVWACLNINYQANYLNELGRGYCLFSMGSTHIENPMDCAHIDVVF